MTIFMTSQKHNRRYRQEKVESSSRETISGNLWKTIFFVCEVKIIGGTNLNTGSQKDASSIVKDRLEEGMIADSRRALTPSEILITKKDESKRFCVDYKGLNERQLSPSQNRRHVVHLDCHPYYHLVER